MGEASLHGDVVDEPPVSVEKVLPTFLVFPVLHARKETVPGWNGVIRNLGHRILLLYSRVGRVPNQLFFDFRLELPTERELRVDDLATHIYELALDFHFRAAGYCAADQ